MRQSNRRMKRMTRELRNRAFPIHASSPYQKSSLNFEQLEPRIALSISSLVGPVEFIESDSLPPSVQIAAESAPLKRASGDSTPSVNALNAGDFYWYQGEKISLLRLQDEIVVGLYRNDKGSTTFDDLASGNGPLRGWSISATLNEDTAVFTSPAILACKIMPTDVSFWSSPVFYSPQYDARAIVTNEISVSLNPGTSPDDFLGEGFASYHRIGGTTDSYVAELEHGAGVSVLHLADQFTADPRVRRASPNIYSRIEFLSLPNDTLFEDQVNLHNTGQNGALAGADAHLSEAWDETTGSTDLVIAVLDTGVQTDHPDIDIWVNPGETASNSTDDDGNGWVDDMNGWDFWDADSDAGPDSGQFDAHGTAVAGVAGASGNNSLGVTGAAQVVKIMSVRIVEQPTSSTSNFLSAANIAEAVYYAAGRTEDGTSTWDSADILNLSFSLGTPHADLDEALEWAATNGRGGLGAAVFVAAGNGGSSSVSYPASLASTIAVGASTDSDIRSSYSQYGSALDFVAPSNGGFNAVTTTDRTGTDGYSTTNYTSTFGGTSAAAPLAAGIAALMLSKNPYLSAAEIRSIMQDTADQIGGVTYTNGRNSFYGHGRVNADAALEAIKSVAVRISDGNDDVEEAADGTINKTSSDLELVVESSIQTVGLRFQDINIPQGATITSAFIEFVTEDTSTGATDVTFKADDTDDAAAFTEDDNDVTDRTTTTAAVSWSIPAWNSIGEAHRSPDLTSVVQEIVSRNGWSSGNNLVFIISGSGTRTAYAYEGLSGSAPLIYVAYTTETNLTDVRIIEGNDDVEEDLADGSMDRTSSDLELMYDSFYPRNQTVGLRFQDINIPQGATITSAYLEFVAKATGSAARDVTIQADDTDDAAAFTNGANNVTDRTTTSAAVSWSIPAWNSIDEAHRSPDLTSVVQEIISRSGWDSGNNLAFVISGSGTGVRTAYAYDHVTGPAPLLHFEYTTDKLIDVRISDGSDDVEETLATGFMYRNSSDLDLIDDTDSSGKGEQAVGLRFRDVDIPQGVTITSAYLEFVTEDTNTGTTNVTIKADNTDDAAAFTATASNLTDRPTTTASVSWNIPAWNTVGEAHRSPDLTSVVQEIVSRTGWTSGNNLAFVISGSGKRTAESYESLPGSAPLLHVLYTTDIRIIDGNDDVEEYGGGSMDLTSSDLELIDDSSHHGEQTVGLRFQDISIPQGATITSAYLQFVTDETDSVETDLTIKAHDTDDAAAFTDTPKNLTDRLTTTASVNWSIPAWDTIGKAHQSPDLTSVVQEIVSRSGWSSGNSLVFVISGEGERTAESYNGVSGSAPLLHFEFTTDKSIDIRVSDGNDDVEETRATGFMYRNSSDLDLIDDTDASGKGEQTVGLRFQDASIPQGATITSAYIEFVTEDTDSRATNVIIQADDTDDAAAFTEDDNNVTDRPTTSAAVYWRIPAWNTIGEVHRSPDLRSIVQEIVSRTGWSSGNDLAFVISGSGKRTAESYNGAAGSAPLLHVEYTTDP